MTVCVPANEGATFTLLIADPTAQCRRLKQKIVVLIEDFRRSRRGRFCRCIDLNTPPSDTQAMLSLICFTEPQFDLHSSPAILNASLPAQLPSVTLRTTCCTARRSPSHP